MQVINYCKFNNKYIKISNILEIKNINIIFKFVYIICFNLNIEFKYDYKLININNIYEIINDVINIILDKSNFVIIAYNYLNLEFIGCVMTDYSDDLYFKKILSPWLTNNFIVHKYRKQGISKLLINKLKHIFISQNKYKTLYLYCSNKQLIKYYHKLKFTFICSYFDKYKLKYLFKL